MRQRSSWTEANRHLTRLKGTCFCDNKYTELRKVYVYSLTALESKHCTKCDFLKKNKNVTSFSRSHVTGVIEQQGKHEQRERLWKTKPAMTDLCLHRLWLAPTTPDLTSGLESTSDKQTACQGTLTNRSDDPHFTDVLTREGGDSTWKTKPFSQHPGK